MLEGILTSPNPQFKDRYAVSPSPTERTLFLRHLKDQGYAQGTLRSKAYELLIIVERMGLMIGPDSFTQEQIDAAADRAGYLDRRRNRARYRYTSLARRWLRFCGRFVEPAKAPMPFSAHIDEFASWMADERGLASSSIQNRIYFLRSFLADWHSSGRALKEIGVDDIDDYLIERTGRWCRKSMGVKAGDLRAFFQYAGRRGWCSPKLANLIETPPASPRERLPSAVTWEQVRKMVEAIPRRKPTDLRDRAICHLLAVYGLRAGEVATLLLGDVDWDHDQIRIRRAKTRNAAISPLAPTVGNAILDYLRKGRPKIEKPALFLQAYAPFRPMTTTAVGHVVMRRLKRFNLSLPRQGAHCLRHACAIRLLDQGLTLKEIGDQFGHTNAATSQIYARVDLRQLRNVGNFDMGGLL